MPDSSLLSTSARAKANLFLEVGSRRADGFHNLTTVMQEVDLADRLTAEAAESGRMELHCDAPGVPAGEENLVLRAAAALRGATGARGGVRFRLEKRIPPGAGLGGGSADAAAALRVLDELWGTGLSREELAAIGAMVGSDVPFFLWGGAALCEGRGERVTPLPAARPPSLLLVLPPWEIATGAAYRALSGCERAPRPADSFLIALEGGDPAAIGRASFNRFEEIVAMLEPRQEQLHARLRSNESLHCVRLSGSGAAVWCLADGDQNAIAANLAAELDSPFPGTRVLPAAPVQPGA